MAPFRKTRVLIIEDDPDIGFAIAEVIRDAGHDIVGITRDAVSGLVLAERTRPDLAIVDVHLTGTLNGISAARQLSENYGTRIVFATGYAESVLLEGQDVEYGLIVKPFSTDELLSAVNGAPEYRHTH